VPTTIVEAASLAGLTGRVSAARFATAPGGPVWLVYAGGGNSSSAYAIDARTRKVVYDYARLNASGGYRRLDYLNVASKIWALEGGGLLLVALGIYVWARGAWRRTLLSLDGPLSARIRARLHRLFYELVWALVLFGIAYASHYSAKTGAPPIIAATVAGGSVALLLWIYASFAVVRSGVMAMESETTEDAAVVGADG